MSTLMANMVLPKAGLWFYLWNIVDAWCLVILKISLLSHPAFGNTQNVTGHAWAKNYRENIDKKMAVISRLKSGRHWRFQPWLWRSSTRALSYFIDDELAYWNMKTKYGFRRLKTRALSMVLRTICYSSRKTKRSASKILRTQTLHGR